MLSQETDEWKLDLVYDIRRESLSEQLGQAVQKQNVDEAAGLARKLGMNAERFLEWANGKFEKALASEIGYGALTPRINMVAEAIRAKDTRDGSKTTGIALKR